MMAKSRSWRQELKAYCIPHKEAEKEMLQYRSSGTQWKSDRQNWIQDHTENIPTSVNIVYKIIYRCIQGFGSTVILFSWHKINDSKMAKLIFCYYWRLHYYNLLFALTLGPSLCTILSTRMSNLDINHHSFSVFYFFLLVFGWARIEHRGLGMQSKHHSTTEVYILPRQCLLNVYRFPFF